MKQGEVYTDTVSVKRPVRWGRLLAYVLGFLWVCAATMPLVLALFSSFKNNAEIYMRPWQLPTVWRWSNYADAIKSAHALRAIGNSLLISFLTAGGVILVALLASYPMSRKNIWWVKKSYLLFVLAVMIPVHVTLVPISSLATALRAKNQYWFLLLVYVAFNMAQSIFLISGYMNGISREIDEAAIIDGCGEMTILFRILTPLCKPILATEAIFAFVYAYGELIFSLSLVSDVNMYPVSRSLLSFYGEGDAYFGPIFAFIILSMIPSIVVYTLFHNQIQGGVMSGAIKG